MEQRSRQAIASPGKAPEVRMAALSRRMSAAVATRRMSAAVATSVLARFPARDAWPVWASLRCEAPAPAFVARGERRSLPDPVSHAGSAIVFDSGALGGFERLDHGTQGAKQNGGIVR